MFIKRMLTIFAIASLCHVIIARAAEPISKIVGIDENNKYIDEFGRQRFFRGLNVVYKGFPYHPKIDAFDPVTSFAEKDMEILASVNMNIIRLGVLWVGVEPERGKYNETYLNIIKNIVDKCSDYGIYVMLDSHQDVMSDLFCGEGFPRWAVRTDDSWAFPLPIGPPAVYDPMTGLPDKKTCDRVNWALLYFSNAVNEAWQRLYDNFDGLRDSFAAQWVKIASLFKDSKSLIGYDLLNEPWPGDTHEDIGLWIPRINVRKNLGPFWDAISAEVRKVDNNSIVFYTGVTWDIFGNGFDHVPGGPDYKNRSAFGYHYYREVRIKPPHIDLQVHIEDLNRTGGATMLTEFEAAYDGGKNLPGLLKIIQAADQYLQSWIGWQYKDFYPLTRQLLGDGLIDPASGDIRPDVASIYSRTFAEAVSGNTISMKFDENEFSLIYKINPTITKPTIIKIQETYHYSKGFIVNISPIGKVEWKKDGNSILVNPIKGVNVIMGEIITINIVPVV
ncbi:13681_t:CDS:2 [Funneliformis caledonium]|uniref:13681_t:CDS:1 n=1 Tax=Funneliformis caledonium TaxID=1117310 RepID=A0A9N8VWH7_9GLOM|nr:13681_t:CDS:2 [Funneliformis caledonium]